MRTRSRKKAKDKEEYFPKVKEEPLDTPVEIKLQALDQEALDSSLTPKTCSADSGSSNPQGNNNQRKDSVGRRKYFSDEERRKASADRRRQKWAAMTPEQRKECSRKVMECKRKRLQKLKEGAELGQKKKKASRKSKVDPRIKYLTKDDLINAEREAGRKWRASMTPEKREERAQKKREYERKVKGKKTGEEARLQLEKKRANSYMWRQAKLGSMTKEEKQEYYRKLKEQKEERLMRMTEEERTRYQERNYFRYQAKISEMTKEEREEWTRKKTEYNRQWRNSMTEERKERQREYLRNWQKKKQVMAYAPKSSEKYQKYLEYQRQRAASETPEQRQKRLRRLKIYQAVRTLKKNLGNKGLPQEEIEARVMELKERMLAEPLPPLESVSSYKPKSSMLKDGGGGEETTRQVDKMSQPVQVPPTLSSSRAKISDYPETEMEREAVVMEAMNPGNVNSIEMNEQDFDFEADDCHDDNGDMSDEDNRVHLTPPPPKVEQLGETRISIQGPRTASPISNDNNIPSPSSFCSSSHSHDLQCPHCISFFPHRTDLTAHICSDHPKRCWKCPRCKIIMLSSAELKEHFKAEHAPKKFKAEKAASSEHAKTKLCKSFACIKCSSSVPDLERTFETQECLNDHVKAKHPALFWPCSKCDLLKYSERSLKVHEKYCFNNIGKGSRKRKRLKVLSRVLQL